MYEMGILEGTFIHSFIEGTSLIYIEYNFFDMARDSYTRYCNSFFFFCKLHYCNNTY